MYCILDTFVPTCTWSGCWLLAVEVAADLTRVPQACTVGALQDNSLGWGSFMAVSSNTRYQIVNTIEERLMVLPIYSVANAHRHPVALHLTVHVQTVPLRRLQPGYAMPDCSRQTQSH